jgi:hypothetical protein
MAKLKTETDEIEIPLIFNDPALTEKMKEWREIVERYSGKSKFDDYEVVGLAASENGDWTAVLRKKQ